MNKRFFRNNIPVQDQDIDSLWQLNADTNMLVLEDDDQYIAEPFTNMDDRFYEVSCPDELKNN